MLAAIAFTKLLIVLGMAIAVPLLVAAVRAKMAKAELRRQRALKVVQETIKALDAPIFTIKEEEK